MIGAARCNQSQPNASGRERIWRRGPDTRQAQFDERGLGPAVWWNHTKLTAPRVATPPLERVGGPLAWWQANLDHREDPGLNPLGAHTSIVNSDRAKSPMARKRTAESAKITYWPITDICCFLGTAGLPETSRERSSHGRGPLRPRPAARQRPTWASPAGFRDSPASSAATFVVARPVVR